jgi:acetylornithine deacetylase/succinyl-diaminopimelate desuccinylase-like protein
MFLRLTISLLWLLGLLGPAYAKDATPNALQAVSTTHSEAAAYLSDLVRIRTDNPPGNERAACDYLAGVLRLANIPFAVLESTPGRANIVARLKGRGGKKPLLLIAHLDTVGVEAERWSFPPFAGDIHEGYVRGRGAIDDKSMAAVFLTTLLRLKREGISLSRDIIFAATADEESGGALGVRWLLQHHPDLLQSEFAINEGGLTQWADGRVRLMAIQSSEKSYYDVQLTARGVSGHASVPHPDNAIHMLSAALTKIETWRRAPRVNSVTRRFFNGVGPLESEPVQRALEDVLSEEPERVERGESILRSHSYYSAMLHDTAVPTIIRGGIRENVVASEAVVNLNVRLLPETDAAEFLESLVSVIDEPGIEVEIRTRPAGPAPPVMPSNSELFRAFDTVATRRNPGTIVVPSMSVGSTDSEFLRRAGILTYGFELPLSFQDEARIHGHDERMPVASLDWGVDFILELLKEVGQ